MFTMGKMTRLLGAVFVALILVACGEKTTDTTVTKKETPLSVKVHTLKKETYPIWGIFTGKTQAVDEVVVISRVKGELTEIHFKPGDIVKKDQLLFTIDKSEYQAIWDQKNAILEKDKASLALATANVKRYTPLVKEQLAPREKLDELVATKKQLEATIRSDKANLKTAKLNLGYTDVKASISGQIGKEQVLIGNIVEEGTELTTIVQSDYLYVNFNPSANEVAIIQQYKSQEYPKVKVFLKNSKKLKIELLGEIDFIDNISNSSTGTVPVRAKVANPKKAIFPGSFVEIEVLISNKLSILAIHPDQVYQNQQGEYIYIVNKENKIETKQIIPVFANNEMLILHYETHKGDRILVGNIRAVSSGMKVLPVEVDNPVKHSEQ
ncbi:MAG: efflux RND transporter periplasmic adaptor subunit [Sulfurovum sp.]|nr:efflux RND transporter periplasmic adaptor subunit [Sulfurovum sp.]